MYVLLGARALRILKCTYVHTTHVLLCMQVIHLTAIPIPIPQDSTPSGSRNASPAPEDSEPKKKKKKVLPAPPCSVFIEWSLFRAEVVVFTNTPSLPPSLNTHLPGGQSEDAWKKGEGSVITLTEVGRPSRGEELKRPLYISIK